MRLNCAWAPHCRCLNPGCLRRLPSQPTLQQRFDRSWGQRLELPIKVSQSLRSCPTGMIRGERESTAIAATLEKHS